MKSTVKKYLYLCHVCYYLIINESGHVVFLYIIQNVLTLVQHAATSFSAMDVVVVVWALVLVFVIEQTEL